MDKNLKSFFTLINNLIKRKNTEFFLRTVLCVFLLFTAISVNGQELLVVEGNLPKSVIVISDSASVQIRKAARFLQEHIKKSTGATLPITSKYATGINSIHIGNTSYVQGMKFYIGHLDEDGFIFHNTDARNFIILGGSDWGTEFGIYSFLERFLDIQFLMPSEIGTHIPRFSNLLIPKISMYDNPVYLSRQLEPVYLVDTDLGNWGRANRLRGRILFSHNLLNLYDPKEFGKTNPEFYYKRITPNDFRWQPDFSAKNIADTGAAKIIRFFQAHPNESSYSLGVNDSPDFDQSPASLKRRKGTKNYLGLEDVSNDYFKWANELVQKVTRVFPDKLFGLLAYSNVAEPPSPIIGVHPNIVPFITYERMRWADSSLKLQGHELNNAWEKEAKVLGWWDYSYGYNYLVPRVWFHQMQQYLQWGARNNVKYYFAELYPNWGEGPKPWVQSKLLWNPDYNVDSLLNLWYIKTAGEKAAPKLKEYYEIWEKFWTKDIFKSTWNTNKRQYLNFYNTSYLNDVPLAYINRSDELINKAYELAGTDFQKQRVSKLKEMWQLYRLAIILYQDKSVSQDLKQKSLLKSSEFTELLNKLQNDPLHAQSIQWIKQNLKN